MKIWEKNNFCNFQLNIRIYKHWIDRQFYDNGVSHIYANFQQLLQGSELTKTYWMIVYIRIFQDFTYFVMLILLIKTFYFRWRCRIISRACDWFKDVWFIRRAYTPSLPRKKAVRSCSDCSTRRWGH